MIEKLPEKIKCDLKGYRGFNEVILPLEIKYIEDFGLWCAHYSFDDAEYSLFVEFGNTREAAIANMKERLCNSSYKYYYHVKH